SLAPYFSDVKAIENRYNMSSGEVFDGCIQGGSSWDRDQRKFVQHDVDPDQLSTEVSPCDVESLWAEDPEQEFALFRHTTKQLEVCGWRESVPITLEQGKAEVVTVVPTQGIRSEHGGRCAWAPIGLEEMYNGGGAVLESSAKIIPRGDGEGTRRLFEVCLRGAGRFIALCGEEPRACQVSGNDVPFTYDQKESKLSIEVLPLDADSEQLSEVTVEAENLRETVLGGKHEKFAGKNKDVAKLSKFIVLLKTEFSTAGLDLASFGFDDPTREIIPLVNERAYDTFSEVVEIDSLAEQYFLATDCSTDRDGRRALIDLVTGCVPAGLRVSHQEEYSALRYPARVDSRPVLAKEHRLVRGNRAADWQPTEATRR
ncbi:hypothetical protein CYMTET_29099, partial [Cymbomonas tetramitiformis]